MIFPRRLALTSLLFTAFLASSAQTQNRPELRLPGPIYVPDGSQTVIDNLLTYKQGHYPGSPVFESAFKALDDKVRQASTQPNGYSAYLDQQRVLAEAREEEERRRERERRDLELNGLPVQARANPDAPDQSEQLKNSHDREFILRNFHTMYVDAGEANFFDSQQLKAALGKNKEFGKLNINIVDDPSVADTWLKVTYTFAWDFPFALRHQNTTIVLVSGKGEGPFSGPLGAADVARQFVNAMKQWREVKEKPKR